jgi:hypothetical protein
MKCNTADMGDAVLNISILKDQLQAATQPQTSRPTPLTVHITAFCRRYHALDSAGYAACST